MSSSSRSRAGTRLPREHREILALALPMIASNLSVPLLGVVDTAVVGHLDSPRYLGAVAVGATVFSFLYTGLNFLRMGTTGLVAQASGARDGTALRAALVQGLAIAALLGAAMIVLQRPLGSFALQLIGAGGDVASLAAEYFAIRIWSAPATLALFVITGTLIGLGRTRAALATVLVQNLTNVALDLLFVPGFGWDVRGVAWATLLADYAAAAMALIMVLRALPSVPGAARTRDVLDRSRLRALLQLNANLLVRTLVLVGVFGFVTSAGARQGEVVLAANALLLQLLYLLAYGLDGFANAAEVLVGRATGARDAAALRAAVRRSLQWTAGVAACVALAYALGGHALLALLTSLPDVRALAAAHLPWLVAAPLVCAWAYLYDGVFVGATLSREMRDTMLFAVLVFAGAWWLLQPLGNHGLWAAFLLFNGARGLAQAWLWRRRA
jgi:MATE family multidrug resistance protein